MKTYDEVVKEVLRFGFDDGPQINKARVEDWVNEGQTQIARKIDAPEFQETETITLTAAKYKYSLPASFLRMQDIYYPEMVTRLRPVDLQMFDLTGEVQGPPDRYTLYKSELWLFPIPNNTDKLELRYIKKPARMTEASAVPTLAEDYLYLLVDYALARAYEAEDDPELAQVRQARYDRDLAKYGVDVQDRVKDRPKQLDGTWATW